MKQPAPRIPLWVKLIYTAFVCVLVPYYWVAYTPWNFLYFCDVALLLTLAGLWLESPFLISMQALGIMLMQTLWVVDFLGRLLVGVHLTGITSYMFKPEIPLFVRGLSLFHGWLPFFLLWLLARLGYDRRALSAQSVLAIVAFLICFFLAPTSAALASHPNAAVNINYVFGFDDAHPQTLMAPGLWLGLLMTFTVVCLYLPTHACLWKLFAPALCAR